jgi:hypothetical protein
MGDTLEVGDLVQYYATKHDATIVAEVIELPNRHKGVKIRVVESPYPKLVGEEWPIAPNRLLKAGGRARSSIGGQSDYEDALLEIRARVLSKLPPDLTPVDWTAEPHKDLSFRYNPEWIGYHIWVSPKALELKLTLGIKDDQKRQAAYDLLRTRESGLRRALGNVELNWKPKPPRTVSEEIKWPGEEGPRPVDIDHIVDRLTLYITTIQPILRNL